MPFETPTVGDRVPRRRGRATKALSRFLLRLSGWRIEGDLPNAPRLVMIGAPHTSNWDFILGLLMVLSLGIQASWIGKHTIFVWPFGPILRALGGIPIDRAHPGGSVRQVIREFETRESFVLALSPEGTRKKVSRWKPGFHRIAKGAGVPVLPVSVDYSRKVIGLWPAREMSDDFNADVDALKRIYSSVTPRHPELF